MKSLTGIILFFNAIILLSHPILAHGKVNVPLADHHDLRAAIYKLHPKAKIVQLEDVDLDSCGKLDHSPGIVEADFNGDGFKDFAVLLNMGISNDVEKEEWYEHVERSINLWFVVFISESSGGFKSFILEKLKVSYPSIAIIDEQLPGIIREWDTNRIVKLKNPGIIRYYCEKSAAVFYWENGKFKHIWTSD